MLKFSGSYFARNQVEIQNEGILRANRQIQNKQSECNLCDGQGRLISVQLTCRDQRKSCHIWGLLFTKLALSHTTKICVFYNFI